MGIAFYSKNVHRKSYENEMNETGKGGQYGSGKVKETSYVRLPDCV